jgi:cytochrome c peroxidase
MPYKRLFGVLMLAGLITGAAQADKTDRLIRKANRYFQPLPSTMPGADGDTAEQIALGRKLYHDPRLSINDAQSCSSCHPVDGGRAGMDGLPTSPGARGEFGTRNSPTVLNAGWQFSQFWDGRARDLADQAGQPILNPIEMGMPDEQSVVDKLAATADYPAEFAAAFAAEATPLTYPNLRRAIAAFESTLRTEARFDDFLQGDRTALSEKEQRGLDTFIRVNCVRCHDGPLVGGGMFEKLGVYGAFDSKDSGRHSVTGQEADHMVFKVPQLRNVALTGPWFHDGSGTSLETVIEIMGRIQLNLTLKPEEIEEISAFLRALTGKNLESGNRG